MKFNPDRMPGVLAGEVRFTTRLEKREVVGAAWGDDGKTTVMQSCPCYMDQNGLVILCEPKYKQGEVYAVISTGDEVACKWFEDAVKNGGFLSWLIPLPRVKILSATPKQLKDITEDEAELAGYETELDEKSNGDRMVVRDGLADYMEVLQKIYPEATDESWAWCYEIEMVKEKA
jgi:hypothetical protein